MSAPYRVVLVDRFTGTRYRLAGLYGRDVVLEDIDNTDPTCGHYRVVAAGAAVFDFEPRIEWLEPTRLSGELLALAEAVEVVQERARGEQPLVEFTVGPDGPGPMWDDAVLARVFGLDSPAGGAA